MKKIISFIFVCLLAFVFVACGGPEYSLAINDADKVISLVEGDEKVVVPSVSGGATLVWESSDPAIASVENGIILAVAEGSATITVSVKEQADLKVTISVTVEAKKVEVKYELKVAEKSVTMVVDDVKTITPTYTQGATLVWASSDATVVSVVNGKLTALKAGTATITVSLKEAADVKAEIAVTVEEKEPEEVFVEEIEIEDLEEITFHIGDTVQLVADVYPYEAEQKLEWVIEPADCAMVTEDNVLYALKGGLVTFYAKSTDGSNIESNVLQIKIFNDIDAMTINGPAVIGVNSTVKYELNIATQDTQSDIEWSSSDESIVVVKGGTVSSIGVGKATITATSLDASAFSTSFEIEVIGAAVYLNGVEYTSFEAAMEVAVEGDVIELGDGIFSSELNISKNNITIKGPNAGRNPNVVSRLEEAKITGTIIVAAGTKNFTLDGVEFTETGGLKVLENCENIKVVNCYAHDTNTGVDAWTHSRNYDIDCVLSFVGNNTDDKNIKNLVVENNLFENVEETCILIGRARDVLVQNNVFHNFGRDAIRGEGGYNYNLWEFYGNELYNDELGGNNGIFLQSVSGTSEEYPIQKIYVKNNLFKNIGLADNTNTYNCAFGFNSFQEKGLICKVEFNTFENCVNYFSMRNNGQAAPYEFDSVIENNIFVGVPTGLYHRNNRPGSNDTETTNPPLTVMDKNLYYDNEGNVITDLTPYAAKFESLAHAPAENYATRADYEAVLKAELEYAIDKYVNPAWAEVADGTEVVADGFTWVIGTNGFASLVKALEAAVEGDVIKLAAGEYAETATIALSNLTFTANPTETKDININAVITINSGVNNTKFEYLRFTGKGQIYGATVEGAECAQDGIIIDNCIIEGSTVDASQATVFTAGPAKNIVFTNNNVLNNKAARTVRSGSTLAGLVVSNNYFEDGGASFDYLRADAAISGDVTIENNVVKGSQQSFIMFMFHGSGNFVIKDNKIYDMACVAIDIRTSNGVACTSTFTIIHNLMDNTNVDANNVWNPLRLRFNDYTEETLTTEVHYNIYINWGDMFLEDASNSGLGWANMDKNYFDGKLSDSLAASNFENIAKSWADAFATVAELEVAYKEYLASLPEEDETVKPTGVTITNKIEILDQAAKYQIEYEVTPEDVTNGKVAFESSDENVATVSATGEINALAAGKVTIKVYCLADQSILDEFELEVLTSEEANAFIGDKKYASLEEALAAAKEGETIVLTAGEFVKAGKVAVNNLTITGPNAGVKGSSEERKDEAVISALITVATGVKGLVIDGVEFKGAGAVALEGTAEDIAVINSVFNATTQDGLIRSATEEVVNIKLNYNYSEAYNAHRVAYFAGTINGLELIGNEINCASSTDFLNVPGMLKGKVVISDNKFVKSAQSFIYISGVGVLDCTISGNSISEIANTFIDMRNMKEDGAVKIDIIGNEFKDSVIGWMPIRVRTAGYDANDTIVVNVKDNKFVEAFAPDTDGINYYINNPTGDKSIYVVGKNLFIENGAVVTDVTAKQILNAVSIETPYASLEEYEAALQPAPQE